MNGQTPRTHPVIEEHIPDGPYEVVRGGVVIPMPVTSGDLRLTTKQLDRLERGEKLRGSGIKYYDHCGFLLKGYAEFLIGLGQGGSWVTQDILRFKCGGIIVEVGTVSHLFPLLMEPHYGNRNYLQEDFAQYHSLRLGGVTAGTLLPAIANVLYQLNSHFLRPSREAAAIHHLIGPEEDFYGPIEKLERLSRKRTVARPTYPLAAPLNLFNEALARDDESQFLGLYRVLEFFFERATLSELSEMRLDKAASDRDLLQAARLMGEESHLQRLLRDACTPGLKKRLSSYAGYKGLIKDRRFSSLVRDLYQTRNSIVHAKEEKIGSAVVPSPVDPVGRLDAWNYIVAECAMAVIKRFNS